jgi:hypothetical protein
VTDAHFETSISYPIKNKTEDSGPKRVWDANSDSRAAYGLSPSCARPALLARITGRDTNSDSWTAYGLSPQVQDRLLPSNNRSAPSRSAENGPYP